MTPSIIDGGGELWTELSQRNIILDRVRITKLVGATAWLSLQGREETVDRWLEAGREWLRNH
jgi:hypothetical protein